MKPARSSEWIQRPGRRSSSRRAAHAISFPSNAACQNTTSAGSYLAHPYGIAIDYTTSPGTLVVADMGSFNGKGAIVRIQPVPNGTQTLLWGPASAVPAPQVAQLSPLGCPMGVAVEPNGNILTTVFTYPVPPSPSLPPPAERSMDVHRRASSESIWSTTFKRS